MVVDNEAGSTSRNPRRMLAHEALVQLRLKAFRKAVDRWQVIRTPKFDNAIPIVMEFSSNHNVTTTPTYYDHS